MIGVDWRNEVNTMALIDLNVGNEFVTIRWDINEQGPGVDGMLAGTSPNDYEVHSTERSTDHAIITYKKKV